MSDSALVIGCGSIGTRHAENLDSLGVELAVSDIDSDRQHNLATRLGAETPESVEQGLSPAPDMVFVCTPSNHHITPAQKAADAGCHLFIEKPLSNTTEGVETLQRTVEQQELTTMVGSNLRFHPAIRTLKRLLNDDAIGAVVSARIEGGSYLPDWHPDEDYRNLYSAKDGVGGALLDYIHELNYAQWVFGEFDTVAAMLGKSSSLEIETEDTAAVIGRSINDVLVEFHLDYIQQDYSRSYHVIGERGSIRWQWGQSEVRRYDPQEDVWVTESQWDEDREMNQMYLNEIEHFRSCVAGDRETITPIAEGIHDLEVALAAKESASLGEHVTV